MKYQAVYAGLRRGTDVPLVALWIKLDQEGNLTEDTIAFGKKGKKTGLVSALIGDVYEIDEDDKRNCQRVGSRIKWWKDQEQREKWRAEQVIAETSVSIEKQAAKEDYGTMTLAEFREMYYKNIGRARRAAILAALLCYITK